VNSTGRQHAKATTDQFEYGGGSEVVIDLKRSLFSVVDPMTRRQKWLFLLLVDSTVALAALFVTCAIVDNRILPLGLAMQIWPLFPLVAICAAGLAFAMGMHRIQLKAYESSAILLTAVLAALVTVAFAAGRALLGHEFPTAGVFLFGLIFFLGAIGARFALLHLLLWVLRFGRSRVRVLIYGAGMTGTQLAAALRTHDSIAAVAFIDDNPLLQGQTIAGLKVLPSDNIEAVVKERGINRVLLAMPSVSAPKLAQITRRLQARGMDVHTVPSFSQLVGAEALVDTLTPVVPGQFLGRRQMDTALPSGSQAYHGKSVLVTGAGGSVGSELCRQLLARAPRRIVLFELSEIGLYTIERELQAAAEGSAIQIVPVLGTITDSRMVRSVMAEHGIEVVFHAAAYKHVPLVEANPIAGATNNILGTRILADAAHDAGVGRFILISTDKAVRPTNVMGATKRMAEIVLQDMARRSGGTVFSMVRFGNVLGSSGSVIPLFKEQIARGGPVTLTHEDVTRYFMTIAEAVRLVLLAGSFADEDGARGGDVFVLDMGKPVKIRDLATQMIEAAGYAVRDADHPDGDIEIVVTGLRKGEKLHEELLIGEGLLTTPHPKILRAREQGLPEIVVAHALRALAAGVASGDSAAVRQVIAAHVEGFAEADDDSAAAGQRG
jgi:FlaA1/EpsC-like NDP-sugar epimerase